MTKSAFFFIHFFIYFKLLLKMAEDEVFVTDFEEVELENIRLSLSNEKLPGNSFEINISSDETFEETGLLFAAPPIKVGDKGLPFKMVSKNGFVGLTYNDFIKHEEFQDFIRSVDEIIENSVVNRTSFRVLFLKTLIV